MPHLWDNTLNKPSLNKTYESEEIFHLSSTQYSVLTNHCTLQWPWKTISFFINNAVPIEQYFKRTVFRENIKSEEIFHLFSKWRTLQSKVLHSQSNNNENIKWLFAHSPPCLTHEYNIGQCDRPQAILALTLRARINIAYWRSPMANVALKSQILHAIWKKPFNNL